MFQMINARFCEIARQPMRRSWRASCGDDTLGRTLEAFVVSARVQDGGLAARPDALVRRCGASGSMGSARLSSTARRPACWRGTSVPTTSATSRRVGRLADELVRHYLIAEAAPGIEVEVELVKRFLPRITAAETAAIAREYHRGQPRRAVDRAGEGRVGAGHGAALRDALRTGLTASVTPWKDCDRGARAARQGAAAGNVKSRREIPEIGVTVLTLSNGVEVWLKPTTSATIRSPLRRMRGRVVAGVAEDYFNASLATSLVGLAESAASPVDMQQAAGGQDWRRPGAVVGAHARHGIG